jgi:DnaJ-class molecular chaperone
MGHVQSDLYGSLGVSRDDRAASIHSAHDELLRQFFAATSHASRFVQELEDAVETLLDARRRARYDELLLAEALAPLQERDELRTRETRLDLLSDFEGYRPSPEEVRDTFRSNFSADAAPKSGRIDTLVLRCDAWQGANVELTLAVPTFHPCVPCHGSGCVDAYTCACCDGTGLAEERDEIGVTLAGRTGMEQIVTLGYLGIRSPILRVQLGRPR